VVAPTGSYVLKPRNVPHALCNAGAEPVRVLEILTPGGLEDYFDEYEQIVESDMDEDDRRRARAELGERYGVIWHDERIPEAEPASASSLSLTAVPPYASGQSPSRPSSHAYTAFLR
jgi:hypothetical protein